MHWLISETNSIARSSLHRFNAMGLSINILHMFHLVIKLSSVWLMTWSYENAFRVTDPLWGESPVNGGLP